MQKDHKKMMEVLLGMVLIIIAAFIGVWFWIGQSRTKTKEAVENSKVTVENTENETSEEEEKIPEEELDITFNGYPEELDSYGITEYQAKKALRDWVDENGYYTANGAVFVDGVIEEVDSEKYSTVIILTWNEEYGQPDGEIKLVMNIFPEQKIVGFRKYRELEE